MGKTNWTRVFLGGLLAGVVLNILYFVFLLMFNEANGLWIYLIVYYFITGILAVWLYSAIRPRYGAGPKTAVIAGLTVGALFGLTFLIFWISVIDVVAGLVMYVVATLAGAWVYKEQE